MRRLRDDRGAAAIEFALVLLPLLAIVLSGLEFGRLYLVQTSLTNAARVAARTMAVESATPGYANPTGDAQTNAITLLNGVVSGPAVTLSMIAISPSSCSAGAPVTATITYSPYAELTNFFPQQPNGWFPNTLIGKATVLCAG